MSDSTSQASWLARRIRPRSRSQWQCGPPRGGREARSPGPSRNEPRDGPRARHPRIAAGSWWPRTSATKPEDRQRRDEERAAPGHLRGDVRVELIAMLDRVDAAVDARRDAGKPGRVGGHLRAAVVGHLGHPLDLGGRPGRGRRRRDRRGRASGSRRRRRVGRPRWRRARRRRGRHGVGGRRQRPRGIEPGPCRDDVRPVRSAPPAITQAEGERSRPAVVRVLEPRRSNVSGPAHAGWVWSRPLCSATRRSASGGSSMRSIQCAPPGRVTWLWLSTMPGTIVAPEASTTSTSAPRSPSLPASRIQATRPPSTRALTPMRRRSERASARAASR